MNEQDGGRTDGGKHVAGHHARMNEKASYPPYFGVRVRSNEIVEGPCEQADLEFRGLVGVA